MLIHLKEFREYQGYNRAINEANLDCIQIMHDGVEIKMPGRFIEDCRFIGLNNWYCVREILDAYDHGGQEAVDTLTI